MAEDKIIESPVSEVELSRRDERIKQLSEKVEHTAKERDEQAKLVKDRDEKIATLEKEGAFSSGYAEVLSTHPAAKDHKDEIKEKVLKGYSVEDAALAVLGKAGKLGAVQAPPKSPAGGSADTAMPQGGQKDIKDMSLAEKRAQLEKEIIWQ